MNAHTVEALTSESPSALATIRTYDELHAALRARAEALQVTRLSMDEVAGLPSGYSGKVLSPSQVKLIGKHSLGALLGVLGVMLVLTEDPEAFARFAARVEKRRAHANHGMLTTKRRGFAGSFGDSEWGKSARNMWLIKSKPRQRQRIARHAAKVRWAKHRARLAAG